MGSFISAVLGSIAAILLFGFLLSSLFMFIGARMAGVEKATFGRAMGAALVSSVVTWLFALLFSVVPGVGTVLGFLVGLLFALFVIMAVFATTFGRAFLTWIFNVLAQAAAVVLAIAVVGGGFAQFLAR